MTRALITGAAGFIGSHVADECLRLGMEVVATDSLSGGFFDNVPADVTWVEGDISDPDFVESLWESRTYDFVYHTAAYAAEGLSHFIRAYNYRTNLQASVLLVNRSVLQGVKRFVFYVVDRGLRGRADSDDRGDDAPPRRSLRHLQVRGRARPGRRE